MAILRRLETALASTTDDAEPKGTNCPALLNSLCRPARLPPTPSSRSATLVQLGARDETPIFVVQFGGVIYRCRIWWSAVANVTISDSLSFDLCLLPYSTCRNMFRRRVNARGTVPPAFAFSMLRRWMY